MDRSISAADANRRFSQILREVRSGKSYLVTSHGTPVARILPARRGTPTAMAAKKRLMDRLEAQEVRVIGRRWRRDELYDS
jgi:prevent-host-death family protein